MITQQLKFVKTINEGTFNGRNGEVAKATIICETIGQYPDIMALRAVGNLATIGLQMMPNQLYNVEFYIKCREYNGRYFTDLNVHNVTPAYQPNTMQN